MADEPYSGTTADGTRWTADPATHELDAELGDGQELKVKYKNGSVEQATIGQKDNPETFQNADLTKEPIAPKYQLVLKQLQQQSDARANAKIKLGGFEIGNPQDPSKNVAHNWESTGLAKNSAGYYTPNTLDVKTDGGTLRRIYKNGLPDKTEFKKDNETDFKAVDPDADQQAAIAKALGELQDEAKKVKPADVQPTPDATEAHERVAHDGQPSPTAGGPHPHPHMHHNQHHHHGHHKPRHRNHHILKGRHSQVEEPGRYETRHDHGRCGPYQVWVGGAPPGEGFAAQDVQDKAAAHSHQRSPKGPGQNCP